MIEREENKNGYIFIMVKAYVPDLDVTAQEYTDAMTLSGTKVEGFTKLDADLENIIIGQIVKIEPAPGCG